MKALIISADGFEDAELLVTYYRLKEKGVDAEIASIRTGTIKGLHGYETEATTTLDELSPFNYDILFLPGGKAPAEIRKKPAATEIAKHFFLKEKPVLAICHGPQILITAGLVKGRHLTCYKSVAPEVTAAGGIYEDKDVVVDGNLVTSRQPADLPAFLKAAMELIDAYDNECETC